MAGSPAEVALAERLLATSQSDYAPWLDRGPSRDVIERIGLPALRSEAWRHTNVRRWYETVLANGADGYANGTGIDAPDAVQVFDFATAEAAELATAKPDRAVDLASQPLAAVNRLLLQAGVVVYAPSGSRNTEPVRIRALNGAFQHILVFVGAGASLTLIEEPAAFTHRIVETVIGEAGNFQHWRRQARSTQRECSLVAARLAPGAKCALAQSARGADLRRNDIRITLAGAGAEATVTGAWRLDGDEHLDNQVAVSHAKAGGFSRQTYRGIAADRARAILNGRIHIAAGANQTDAALSTKNLLASDTAQIFAKPELEIHASDVQCAHGATVGTLDDAAIHYLRSRGIGEEAARELLLRGFLREAITDADGAQLVGIGA